MAKKATGIMRELELSEDMADFMGKDFASRAAIIKKIWAHIKKYDLQNENDRRTIEPDDTLAPILGKRSINMMKIASKISEHII